MMQKPEGKEETGRIDCLYQQKCNTYSGSNILQTAILAGMMNQKSNKTEREKKESILEHVKKKRSAHGLLNYNFFAGC